MSYRPMLCAWVFLLANTSAMAAPHTPIYYETYPCEEGNASSTCIVGSIPAKAGLILVMKDRALAAHKVRELPQQVFSSGLKTGTLVQTTAPLLPEAKILGIKVAASSVSIVKQVEQSDPALVQKIESYLNDMNANYAAGDQWKHRWLNPHAKTQVVQLADGLRVAETTVKYDEESWDPAKRQIKVDCSQCAEEHITFVAHRSDLFELFQRKDQIVCSEAISAFRFNRHIELFATATGCNNGAYEARVYDLSEFPPQPVFSSTFFSD